MKLLMHVCCAPCSVYCIDSLRKEGIEPTLFWYNPNIHPYKEYETRRNCLKEYADKVNIKSIIEDEYGLDEFCKNVAGSLNTRCVEYCYKIRLKKSFEYARDHGFDAVTTTLLYSIYQKHDFIKLYGQKLAKEYGIEFLYRDFRVGFWKGHDKAIQLGLYMQKYCGCVFSEWMSNYDHIISEQKARILENKITEKRIRLGWDVPNLELKPYKNGNQEEIKFIYNLKKEVYQEYVEKIYGEWNEENQKKLFNKFMKENSKNIELIYLKDKLVGFYNGKLKDDKSYEIDNICIMPEYQNRGIGTAVLKEILFENKDKEIILQCFKENQASKLYERMGFKKIEETKTHYIMIKK